MIPFVQHKKLNRIRFFEYLESAEITNQYTNYGYAVQLLEQRARDLLKIDDSKAIIATCNGAAALNVIMQTLQTVQPVYSQDFTFPCNFQIPDVYTESFDIDEEFEPNIDHITDASIIIITNCFGHVVNIDRILQHAKQHNQTIVFDNAASPYSFYNNSNISNYGIASYVSLHHTKPLGFGEGGLVIIDKQYEDKARSISNFGLVNRVPTHKGNNYKMSELAAAGILQWWDSFNIDELKAKYMQAYSKYAACGCTLSNYSNDFFPNCVPIIEAKQTFSDMDIRKYYMPNRWKPNSTKLYTAIQCIPITEYLNA